MTAHKLTEKDRRKALVLTAVLVSIALICITYPERFIGMVRSLPFLD